MILINQLAKKAEVPIHTIRYYERYGLLKGKKDTSVKSNNYTFYDDTSVEKLEMIKHAKEIGFTLTEIKELLDAWISKRLTTEKKIAIFESKIAEIEKKIDRLKLVKKMLAQTVKDVKAGQC